MKITVEIPDGEQRRSKMQEGLIRSVRIIQDGEYDAVAVIALSGNSVKYMMSTADSISTQRMASALMEYAEIKKSIEESGDAV